MFKRLLLALYVQSDTASLMDKNSCEMKAVRDHTVGSVFYLPVHVSIELAKVNKPTILIYFVYNMIKPQMRCFM